MTAEPKPIGRPKLGVEPVLIRLTGEQRAKLDSYRKDRGISLAQAIREIVDNFEEKKPSRKAPARTIEPCIDSSGRRV